MFSFPKEPAWSQKSEEIVNLHVQINRKVLDAMRPGRFVNNPIVTNRDGFGVYRSHLVDVRYNFEIRRGHTLSAADHILATGVGATEEESLRDLLSRV